MTWCFSSESCPRCQHRRSPVNSCRSTTYPFPETIQDLDLYQSLVVETLLVPDDLDGHGLPSAVIATVKHLPEGALTQSVDNLVTIRQVVAADDLVVTAFVVVAVVVCRDVGRRHLFLALGPDVVDRLVVQDLLTLIFRQIASLLTLEDNCEKDQQVSEQRVSKQAKSCVQCGDIAGAGGIGSGKRSIASRSSCEEPLCSFFACCRLMYCIISSSPSSSSSSTELGAGDGVENDCRLVDGDPMVC